MADKQQKKIKGYVYHRTLYNHTEQEGVYIRRLGHLARRDPSKVYEHLHDVKRDPGIWVITFFHEALELESGRVIPEHSLSINNVLLPLPKLNNNPLHSWIRLCGDKCPALWEDLGLEPGVFLTGIDGHAASLRLHDIYQELIGNRKQDPKALLPMLQLFLYECQRSTNPDQDILPSSVQRVLHLLSEDEGMRMSIEELAAHAGCSSRQLSRLCKEYLLNSPIEIRRQQRLLRVTELLADPQRNLSGIAHQVGYADAFSLSKAYRKAYGHSPRA